jgi:hypothetical protein
MGGVVVRITRESGSSMSKPVDKISSPRAEAKLLKAETLFLTTCNNNNRYILSCGRYSSPCTGLD